MMMYKALFIREIELQILRRNDIVRAKNLLHRPLIKQCTVMRKQITAVMADSNIVRIRILPRPVHSGQLTVITVLRRDIISRIVPDIHKKR